MTLTERLTAAQSQMGQFYLRREQTQAQLQQLQHQAKGLEAAMFEVDGEIRLLQALISDAEKAQAPDGV